MIEGECGWMTALDRWEFEWKDTACIILASILHAWASLVLSVRNHMLLQTEIPEKHLHH